MLAMEQSDGVDVQYGSALALAYAGSTERAQDLTDGLDKRFPEATIVQFNYLPTLRAKLALNRGNASEALETLRAAVPYELGRTTLSDYSWNGGKLVCFWFVGKRKVMARSVSWNYFRIDLSDNRAV